MDIKAGYKITDVGIIPADWDVVPVCSVATNYTGLTYSPENVSKSGTLVLRSSNVQGGQLCFNDNVYVEMEIPKRAKVEVGDILVCVRNGSSALIGKSALITDEAKGMAFGAFMTVLRAYDIDNKYLLYVWQNDETQRQVHETFGATINQITSADFKRIVIPKPSSKEEQSMIASSFFDVDELIKSLNSQISKKKQIKEGTMQQFLTCKKRLPGFEGKWVYKTIGECCNLFGRIGFRGYTKQDLVRKHEGAITFSPSNIHEQVLDTSNCDYISFQKYEESPEIKVYNGDILFCKTASIGKCAIVQGLTEKATINPQFVVLKDFKCNNYFLYYVIAFTDFQDRVKSITGGSTIPTMSQEKLKLQRIMLPPSQEEQKALAAILSDMDMEIQALEGERDKYLLIKQGMMQDLLTGKTRLI